MDLKNRLKIDDLKQNISAEDVYHAAQKCFGHLSDGFVIVGYCRDTHRKFLWKITTAKVYDDAFEVIKDPIVTWFGVNENEERSEQ